MSMSVGFRTLGSEANSETSRPSATLSFFTDSRAASGPTPAGLAANNAEAASASGARTRYLLSVVELVALRRVVPRPAAQERPANRAVPAAVRGGVVAARQ